MRHDGSGDVEVNTSNNFPVEVEYVRTCQGFTAFTVATALPQSRIATSVQGVGVVVATSQYDAALCIGYPLKNGKKPYIWFPPEERIICIFPQKKVL